MPFINALTQEYPLTAQQVAQAFPNTSFPRDQAQREAAFAERGYHRVEFLPEPTYDASTHKAVRRTTPALVDGAWVMGWDVIALDYEEIAQNLDAWREQATCTPRQFRRALLIVGLLDDVEAMMPHMPREVQIDWEYAVLLERRNPQWDQLGASMTPAKTPVDIDAVFRLAQAQG